MGTQGKQLKKKEEIAWKITHIDKRKRARTAQRREQEGWSSKEHNGTIHSSSKRSKASSKNFNNKGTIIRGKRNRGITQRFRHALRSWETRK